jgi:TPR repeat protein
MRTLASILTKGDGDVAADPPRAEALLKQAVSAGDVVWGSYSLGDFYRADTPLKDPAKAIAAYQQSAEAGNTQAMRTLAGILTKGEENIPADPSRALSLIEQAIADGDVSWGAYALGNFYQADTPLQNSAKAVEAYQKAADAGNTSAMRALANVLVAGTSGVGIDPNRAELLLKQAVAGGDTAEASYALGKLYESDMPLKDEAKAVLAYQAALDAGNDAALFALVALLTNDKGKVLDLDRARSLLEGAIKGPRVQEAAFALAKLYERKDFSQNNSDKAVALFEQAADAGNNSAYFELVRIQSGNVKDSKAIAEAVDNAHRAGQIFGPDAVLDMILHLPATSVVALMQRILLDAGEVIKVTGVHGKQTEDAISHFCAAQNVSPCNPKFITSSLLRAAIFGR